MTHRTGDNTVGGKQVVDFTEARIQKLDEKRRKTERIFFKHLLGVYAVAGNSQMRSIEMIEVSEHGCSFQVPYDSPALWPADSNELAIRLYFSQDTYIPVTLKITNSNNCIDNGARFMRYGCSIDESVSSYPAYQQFVRFLKLYSEHAHKDMGDVTVFYL